MKTIGSNGKSIRLMITLVILSALSFFIYEYVISIDKKYVFETVVVKNGTISNVITATGTLEATNTVVVGTQVSGVIENIYVDFNSKVEKGQLIAELDKSTLQSSLETAKAMVNEAEAEYAYQQANFERQKELYEKEVISKSDYDLAEFGYKKSLAALESTSANLAKAQRNLSYAMIYAPIDGVVLNRAVEEGQTVTASLNTPELFTITNDLKMMQVEADIDEADIGVVEEGQQVYFTVDAFPDETFEGTVSEIRLQPKEVSNVVTYTVIIDTTNPETKLKPGMTANITIYVNKMENVLTLAGKALRFKPDLEAIENYVIIDDEMDGKRKNKKNSSINEKSKERAPRMEMPDNKEQVWVKSGEFLRPVIIETGVDDGISFEVLSGLKEGDVVAFAMNSASESKDKNNGDNTSPFVQSRSGRQ